MTSHCKMFFLPYESEDSCLLSKILYRWILHLMYMKRTLTFKKYTPRHAPLTWTMSQLHFLTTVWYKYFSYAQYHSTIIFSTLKIIMSGLGLSFTTSITLVHNVTFTTGLIIDCVPTYLLIFIIIDLSRVFCVLFFLAIYLLLQ